MSQTMRSTVRLLLLSSFILHPSSLLQADGGSVRLSEQKGGYRITVFTEPTPLRAGPVDVSVLVQDASTGEPASDVQVTFKVSARGSPVVIRNPATTEAATNKLYYAARFDLPEPGWYAVEVAVTGSRVGIQVHFDLEAGEPLPPYLAEWPWFGWPVLVILLFIIHQTLVIKRRSRRAATARRTSTASGAGSSGDLTHSSPSGRDCVAEASSPLWHGMGLRQFAEPPAGFLANGTAPDP